MPVTTSSTETSALPCHLPVCRISEFLAAAFASNRRFRDLFEASHGWWMRERRAGWGVLRVRSEYSCRRRFPNLIGPQDLPTVLLAGTGWVGDPVGPAHRLTPAAPCTGMDAQRCIGRRASANAESASPRPRRAQAWTHSVALGGVLRQTPNRPKTARRKRRRRCSDRLQQVRLSIRHRWVEGGVPPSAVQVDAVTLCRAQRPHWSDRTTTPQRRRGHPGPGWVTLRCTAQPIDRTADCVQVHAKPNSGV
jgi:hypothetical protein